MAKSQGKKPEKLKSGGRSVERKPPGRMKASSKQKARKGDGKKIATLIPITSSDAVVLDRLHSVILSRREADPATSHSARLLSRGTAKVAQKFGEEAVECLIESVAGNHEALVAESADVLYHLIVLWVSCGVTPDQVWAELARREGISGIAEKAARPKPLLAALKPGTSKIP
jgi:phosphoribosyl-ATP pyrophosphohydrolase